MKRNGFSKAWEAMLAKGDSAWGVARNATGRSAAFTTFNSAGTPQDLVGSTIVDDNGWHHIVAVFTGSVKQLYVDGVLIGSTSYAQTVANNNLNLRMGMNQEFVSAFYGGALDEIRVYGRALTTAEVTALFTQ